MTSEGQAFALGGAQGGFWFDAAAADRAVQFFERC
jgi:hypothetical protein